MTDKNSKLRSNIWKYYLQEILLGMFFSIPIIVLFWQNNGLSLTEIMILQSIFAVMVVVLEIPTGYFADVYGRKKALVLASIFSFLAITLYSLGRNFAHFLVAEIFFALGTSFASGTSSAFIYDTLVDLKEEGNYKRIWGNAIFVGMISLALSNVFGGLIAKIDLRYTLYASIPFFALRIPITLTMVEPKKHKVIFEKGYTHEILKIVKIALIENKKLRWLIVYSGIVYAFYQASMWLYQPYFKLSGLDIAYFGLVFASFQGIAAVSSKYAHQLEKKLGQKYSLIMLIFLVSGGYFLMSNFIFLFSFSFSFLHQFVRGFKKVIIDDYLNKLTTSGMRATVLSVESFVGRLLYAAIIPIIGWIADIYSLVQAMTVLAFTTLISGILILILLRRNKII